MPERWQRELETLRGAGPRADIWPRVEEGPHGTASPIPGRKRLLAGGVAFAVFIAAGAFAWNAFRPASQEALPPAGSPQAIMAFNEADPRAPTLTLTVGGDTYPATLGTHSYSFDGGSGFIDAVPPTFADADAVPVVRGTPLLVANGPPTLAMSAYEGVTVNWGPPVGTPLELDLTAPGWNFDLPSGRYLVVVDAQWNDAAAQFWLPIQVVDETGATSTPPQRIDASITQTVDTGLRFPEGVVIAYGGVWVVGSDGQAAGGELLRLDRESGEVLARIALPTVPGWEFGGAGIASGLDNVWVAAGRANEPRMPTVVYRIDPDTNTLAETIDVGAGLAADVWVDDTGIWVTSFADDGAHMWLYHLDVATHEVLSRTSIPANWANTVAGAGGWIWLLGNTDDGDGAPPGTLFRIDPTTGELVDQFDPAPGESFSLAVSSDRLWFFKSDGLYALDANNGSEVVGPLDLPARGSAGLVSDGTGGVWVVSGKGSEALAKGVWHVSADGVIDQHAGENPGDLADGIAAAFDQATMSIWIVHYQDTVSRLQVTPAEG